MKLLTPSSLSKSSKLKEDQFGFHVFEMLLIAVVLGLIGFLAFTVIDGREDANSNATVPANTQQAAEINNEQDLQQAEDTLDDINLDELDTSELDAIESELL